jgi:hypothetical protein
MLWPEDEYPSQSPGKSRGALRYDDHKKRPYIQRFPHFSLDRQVALGKIAAQLMINTRALIH